MAGYKTLDVLHEVDDISGRIPIVVAVEKQQRVREDESSTRPFIKMKLVIGNRIVFCDVRQAESLANLIQIILPDAEESLNNLMATQAAIEESQAQDDSQSQNDSQDHETVTPRRVRKRRKSAAAAGY